jgi:hypothetical protein
MFENSLTIKQPFGISVFGSGLIRVVPDIATIRVAVSAIDEKPSNAFSEARQRAQTATGFLERFSGLEFGTSRIRLASEYRLTGVEKRFIGYRARIGITVQLRKLEILEEVTTGLIEAGANEIEAIDFQASQLKKLRTDARAMAMAAAREKADLYASAAGVTLGKVIHIQDVNPEVMNMLNQPRGHGAGPAGPEFDVDSGERTFDPAAINIQAAVLVAYAIE